MGSLARRGNAAPAYLPGQNGRGYSSTIGKSVKANRCTFPVYAIAYCLAGFVRIKVDRLTAPMNRPDAGGGQETVQLIAGHSFATRQLTQGNQFTHTSGVGGLNGARGVEITDVQSTANIPEFNPCELAAIEDETTGRKEIHPVGEDGPAFADVFDPAFIIELS